MQAKDYYGKSVFLVTITVMEGQMTLIEKQVPSDWSSKVAPAKNCSVVLNGCSVPEQALFEVSKGEVGVYLTLGKGVTGHTFCLKDNVAQAKQALIKAAQTLLGNEKSNMQRDYITLLENLSATLSESPVTTQS